MARSWTTTAYRWLFRDAPSTLRTLWSAEIQSPNFSARRGASPVRLLQGALVILVRKQTSQFRSFGKWVLILCILDFDTIFVRHSESESWEMCAGACLNQLRISLLWSFRSGRQDCPGFKRSFKRSFVCILELVNIFFATSHATLRAHLSWCKVSSCDISRIWARKDFAHEVHTFELFLAMDPFFPEFWCGARCPWRIWRRVLVPNFLFYVLRIFSDKNLEIHNPIV